MSDSSIEKYIDQENLHRSEGETGVKNLNSLTQAIGYQGHGFRYGSPLEDFLQDNPGCIDAIKQWIIDANVEEWNEQCEAALDPEDDEDEEEWEDEEGGGYGEANG